MPHACMQAHLLLCHVLLNLLCQQVPDIWGGDVGFDHLTAELLHGLLVLLAESVRLDGVQLEGEGDKLARYPAARIADGPLALFALKIYDPEADVGTLLLPLGL